MFWQIVRFVVVLASAVGVLLRPPYMPANLHSQWLMPLATLLAFPAVVVVGLVVLFALYGPKLKFTIPSWRCNPFNFSHPEQFFHLGAFVFLAQGAVLLVRQLLAGSGVGAGALAIFTAGCGVWLGLRILAVAFRMQSRYSF